MRVGSIIALLTARPNGAMAEETIRFLDTSDRGA